MYKNAGKTKEKKENSQRMHHCKLADVKMNPTTQIAAAAVLILVESNINTTAHLDGLANTVEEYMEVFVILSLSNPFLYIYPSLIFFLQL